MLDVTNCPKIQDENRGVNEKLWIDVDGRVSLFKKTQVRENGTHTNAHFSEAFVSDICKKVGFNCAEIDIAKRGEDIGCISYSFLDDGDELIDFIALIQNIRLSFDSKKMIVADTNEKYSIPLILEALEEECRSVEEFNSLRKEFLKSCVIDSLIEHYDRNPSNISIIRNKNGIKLAPMFDNGTSLSISIPSEVVKENINKEGWMEEIREQNKSKIGVEGEKYSNYDRLLEYILSNYYGDVKEFLEIIHTELTSNNIRQMLSEEKYNDLEELYKEFIVKKLSTNRERLLEQSNKYELKYQVEELMSRDNIGEQADSVARNEIIQKALPEMEGCIDCQQRNPYHIHSVDKYIFHCIENINNLEEICKESNMQINISDKDRRVIQWAIMFNEMGKPQAKEEITNEDGTVRDTFRNYSQYGQEIANKKMEELNFYETEKETISKLIASHDRRSLETDSSIKRFIDELGDKNLDLYFAMKLAETNAKNPELKEEGIQKLKNLKQKIEEIQKNDNRNIIKVLPQNGKKIMALGLKGAQIGELQQKLANYVRENDRIYTYYKARGHLEKYRKELSQYASQEAKNIKHKAKAEKLQQSVKQSQQLSEKIEQLQNQNQTSRP